jgi:geranylgeranylglycerol-phosphate geranylgeranyltransferase
MTRFIGYLQLIRIVNCLMTSAGVWVGAYLTLNYSFHQGIPLTLLGGFCICGAGNVLNDILDIKIDRISHPKRPLVTGILTIRSAWVTYFVFMLVGLVAAAWVNIAVFSIALFTTIILILYNIVLKKIVLIGNITIAFLGGLTFITGGLTISTDLTFTLPGPLIAALFAILLHLVREMVKDIQDIDGDKALGILTLPQKIGVKPTLVLGLSLILILAILTYYPFRQDWFSIVYFVIVILGVILPVLVLMIKPILNSTPRQLVLCSKGIKLGMFFGLLSFVIGKNF